MKLLFVWCFTGLLCLPLLAANLAVGSLDTPIHTDLEVNRCLSIPDSCYAHLRIFTLEITFKNASPSNGFYVAFGNDTGNGYLEFEEMVFQIGFDQGKWQLREKGMVNTYTCSSSFSPSGTKNLKMQIRVDEAGNPLSVTFADNGQSFTFPGLDLSSPKRIPEWITPPFADLKVTRRGYFANDPQDSTSLTFSRGGIKVIIR